MNLKLTFINIILYVTGRSILMKKKSSLKFTSHVSYDTIAKLSKRSTSINYSKSRLGITIFDLTLVILNNQLIFPSLYTAIFRTTLYLKSIYNYIR